VHACVDLVTCCCSQTAHIVLPEEGSSTTLARRRLAVRDGGIGSQPHDGALKCAVNFLR